MNVTLVWKGFDANHFQLGISVRGPTDPLSDRNRSTFDELPERCAGALPNRTPNRKRLFCRPKLSESERDPEAIKHASILDKAGRRVFRFTGNRIAILSQFTLGLVAKGSA